MLQQNYIENKREITFILLIDDTYDEDPLKKKYELEKSTDKRVKVCTYIDDDDE